jgi:hypothetical protein
VHSVLQSEFSIVCLMVCQFSWIIKAKFKVSLKKYLNIHSFSSVDDFLCVKIIMLFYNTFIVFLHCKILYTSCVLWLVRHPDTFMTHLWIHRMYNECMCVCMYVYIRSLYQIQSIDSIERKVFNSDCWFRAELSQTFKSYMSETYSYIYMKFWEFTVHNSWRDCRYWPNERGFSF